jgi:hypothetical protein
MHVFDQILIEQPFSVAFNTWQKIAISMESHIFYLIQKVQNKNYLPCGLAEE